MKKKILAIGLVVCMLVVAIGSATMAYFTDTESANNVMIVGKIDIEQHEQEADGSEFEQDKTLLPNVQVDKIVTVENTGNSDAYFRTFVAFEGTKEFVDTYLDITKHERLVQYGEIQIGSGAYTLYVYIHPAKLAADEISDAILTSFTLKPAATQEDVAFAGEKYNVWVVTEAVQADGFEGKDAKEALNLAFGKLGAQAVEYTGYHPFGDTSWYYDNLTETVFTLTDRADLLGFAALVNGGVDTFEGKIVKLGADIDLSDIEWAPIGTFKGTFDGQNKTIYNLNATDADAAGLFGYASVSTIKNLNVVGATINSNHYAGAIAAHGLCAKIENCHVVDANITTAAEQIGDAWNNGDKAGGIVGYLSAEPEAYVKGCSVTDSFVTGYRDIGGLVGMANGNAEVSGNTVENTTITVDFSHNYNNITTAAKFNANKIVGRGNVGANTDGTNTATNVTIVVPTAIISTVGDLQDAIDNAVNGDTIVLGADITGDVTVTQKSGVKFTIEGNGHEFNGVLLVDGESKRYETAGLTIQNVNFNAEGISADACIRMSKDNTTRYTNNVTVKDCTFTDDDQKAAAVRSHTGGDWNLTIENCTVNSGMHSLAQLANVEKNLTITGCKVYSKNGINLNNTPSLTMSGCEFNVTGYAIRVGVNDNGNIGGADKTFNIANSTLKSACEASDDAVIVFRDNAAKATLNLTNTTLEGVRHYLNETNATIVNE